MGAVAENSISQSNRKKIEVEDKRCEQQHSKYPDHRRR